MKAIFVVRSEGCARCPFWINGTHGEERCGADQERDFPELDVDERPDWCPLLKEGQVMVALEPEK